MKDLVICVLGGMGTYATINLFKQYAEVFPAEKEWERPRIVIDNRCTMPSRVRAFLYHENVDKLLDEMTDSIDLSFCQISMGWGGDSEELFLLVILLISSCQRYLKEFRKQRKQS